MRGKRGGGSRRGRKVAGPEASAREVYLQLRAAALVVFACEWAGCRAELHNLETLRRHVALVHVAAAADGRCRWGKKCQAAAAGGQGNSVSEGDDGLARHVEERHMVPYAWYVGDGPRNDSIRGSLDAREDYLMDKEGNQVTPSVKDQEVEDHATWRENRRKLRELLIERDRNLPSESEEEEDD